MLVDISTINPRIILDIKYATADNFVGMPVYSLAKAYARKEVVYMLDTAQGILEDQGLGLKIWDAYRPLGVQQVLWDMVSDSRYVADPEKGSAHNRGAAVDVTVVDSEGNELSMPTGFDDFSEKAHLVYDDLSDEVLSNRELLVATMVSVGFEPFDTEWWHYSIYNADSYPLLSMSFEELQALSKD